MNILVQKGISYKEEESAARICDIIIMFIICVHLRKSASHLVHARVAELADALDLGSSGVTRRGSNPLSRTI